MANFDSGATYDSGLFYDAVSPPPPSTKKTMSRVKLTLSKLNDEELVQLWNNVKTAMTGNANFATPIPALATLTTSFTMYGTSITAAQNSQTTTKQLFATKDNNRAASLGLFQQLIDYVNLTSNGDATKIMSAGMAVQSAKTPSGVPAQVMNLSITSGDNAGELDLHWDPVIGIKSYDVQLSPDPMTATSWQTVNSVTKSKAAQFGLTSGARMWVRVRGVGPGGQGPWSDPATKIVP